MFITSLDKGLGYYEADAECSGDTETHADGRRASRPSAGKLTTRTSWLVTSWIDATICRKIKVYTTVLR
jgi:hypothetical protein